VSGGRGGWPGLQGVNASAGPLHSWMVSEGSPAKPGFARPQIGQVDWLACLRQATALHCAHPPTCARQGLTATALGHACFLAPRAAEALLYPLAPLLEQARGGDADHRWRGGQYHGVWLQQRVRQRGGGGCSVDHGGRHPGHGHQGLRPHHRPHPCATGVQNSHPPRS